MLPLPIVILIIGVEQVLVARYGKRYGCRITVADAVAGARLEHDEDYRLVGILNARKTVGL